jgi:hypothetical protein
MVGSESAPRISPLSTTAATDNNRRFSMMQGLASRRALFFAEDGVSSPKSVRNHHGLAKLLDSETAYNPEMCEAICG